MRGWISRLCVAFGFVLLILGFGLLNNSYASIVQEDTRAGCFLPLRNSQGGRELGVSNEDRGGRGEVPPRCIGMYYSWSMVYRVTG